jgi:hypothetical protein
MKAQTRLQLLSRHLCATAELQGQQGPLCDICDICPEKLNRTLLHDHRELRAAVLDLLKVNSQWKLLSGMALL